jgi:hypothetical protein
MLIAERIGDASMAQAAISQIDRALATLRDVECLNDSKSRLCSVNFGV